MTSGRHMELIAQFSRYGLLGVLSNVLAYISFVVLTHYGMEPKLTMSMLYVIVFMISFLGNKHWTFSHTGAMSPAMFRFVITHAIGYAFNLLMLSVFVDRLDYDHRLVQLAVMGILVFYFFFALRLFVFRQGAVR